MPKTSERVHPPVAGPKYCPACGYGAGAPGAAHFAPVFLRLPQRRIVQCPRCRSYVNLGREASGSDAARHEHRVWGPPETGIALGGYKSRMFVEVAALCRELRPAPAKLLDIGCSYGAFLTIAAGAGYEVYGSDILPAAVRHVQGLGFAAAECSSLREFTLTPPGELDIITCLDVNYYWDNQPEELQLAHKLLKSGGLIVIRTATKSWMVRMARAVTCLAPEIGGRVLNRAFNDHRFTMPPVSLQRVLRDTGFNVVRRDIRRALHSDDSDRLVKANFLVGRLMHAFARMHLAPGIVLVAQRA